MTKNDGKPYETLTDRVIQGLSRFNGVKTIAIQKDVDLDGLTIDENGKPFTHQIDLVWDFEVDGKAHRTVFQAKDWNYCVDRPTFMTFCAVLADLLGSPTGVIVTRTGFDSTLIAYAKAKGIGLYILDDLDQVDFVSCIPRLELRIDQAQKGYALNFIQTWHPKGADGNHSEQDPKRASDAAFEASKLPAEMVSLYKGGKVIGTVADLLKRIFQEAEGEGLTLYDVCIYKGIDLEDPLYICTSDPEYPRVQLGGVACEIKDIPIGTPIILNYTLSHVLQFCTNGEQYFVDNDFTVHKAGQPFVKRIEIAVGPDEAKQPLFIEFCIPIRSVPIPTNLLKLSRRPKQVVKKRIEDKKKTTPKKETKEKKSGKKQNRKKA